MPKTFNNYKNKVLENDCQLIYGKPASGTGFRIGNSYKNYPKSDQKLNGTFAISNAYKNIQQPVYCTLNPSIVNASGDVAKWAISKNNECVVFNGDFATEAIPELYSTPLKGGFPQKLNATLPSSATGVDDFIVSPDSTKVVYVADQTTAAKKEIYSVAIKGGTPIKLNAAFVNASGDVQTTANDVLKVSQDSLYVVYRSDSELEAVNELYSALIGTAGSSVKISATLVTSGDVGTNYDISPNSATVVFIADKTTNDVQEIYSVPIAGGTVTKLNGTMVTGGDVASFLISKDSARVVYLADQDTDAVNELYSVKLDGTSRVKLSATLVSSGDVLAYKISDDSTRVIFVADKTTDAVNEIYSVPIAGGTVTKLNGTMVSGGDVSTTQFFISKDSTRVVYIADQTTDTVDEVYSVPIAGGTAVKLNSTLISTGDVTACLISANSKYVVYLADQDTASVAEVYVVLIGGGTPLKLNGKLVASGNVLNIFIDDLSYNVIYVADQDTNAVNELYSVPLKGGVPIKLNGTMVSGGDVSNTGTLIPQISPNSKCVVYRADKTTNDKFELFSSISKY